MENIYLVTGGSGTLGKAAVGKLIRQGATAKVVVFGRDEAAQAAMAADPQFRTPKVAYELGDVTRKESVRLAISRHKATHVIHAAAMKHVPYAEAHPSECVEINVVGSRNVLQACLESGTVRSATVVSTDKAARPSNAYGLSKALMERLVPEFDGVGGIKVNAARFGNLVGSRGSVLELFLGQIRTQGEVTVTDPEMTRFFIRVSQAADAVIYAIGPGPGGQILIPQMRAALLSEFVKAAVEYSRRQARVRVIGARPGERRHEMIVSDEETPRSVQPNEFLGIALAPKPVAKPAIVKAISSETSPRMQQDELLGMIAEAAGHIEPAGA